MNPVSIPFSFPETKKEKDARLAKQQVIRVIEPDGKPNPELAKVAKKEAAKRSILGDDKPEPVNNAVGKLAPTPLAKGIKAGTLRHAVVGKFTKGAAVEDAVKELTNELANTEASIRATISSLVTGGFLSRVG